MPALPISMAKGLKKSPIYNTVLQKTACNRGNASASLTPFRSFAFEFDLDAVQGNEALLTSVTEQFNGVLALCCGRAGTFLFTDAQDNAVTQANSGMLNVTPGAAFPMSPNGDGVSTQFQLARSIGGVAWDIIQQLNGTPKIYINDVQTYAFSISNGLVTFNPSVEVPPNNASLTWSGSYYYLCRFDEDTVNAVRMFTTNSGADLWNVDSIKFTSEFC